MAQSQQATPTNPDPARGEARRETADALQPILIRFLVLVALVLIVEFWLSRHLQAEVKSVLAVTTAAAAAIALVLPHLEKPARETLRGGWKRFLRRAMAFSLRTPALAGAALLIAGLGSMCSSVIVVNASAAGARHLALRQADGSEQGARTLKAGGTERFFPLWVEPAGSRFVLHVEGCLPHTFELRPWVGATIRVEDLRPAPAVVVRLPFGVAQNRAGGEFQVERNGDSAGSEGPIDVHEGHGALLLGGHAALPPGVLAGWAAKWRTAAEHYEAKPHVHADVLFAWTHPRWIRGLRGLVPGDQLRVRFLSDGGELAAVKFAVSAEPFQDVVMAPAPGGGPERGREEGGR